MSSCEFPGGQMSRVMDGCESISVAYKWTLWNCIAGKRGGTSIP